QHIGQRLAGPGAGFNDADGPFCGMALSAIGGLKVCSDCWNGGGCCGGSCRGGFHAARLQSVNGAKAAGDLGNHQTLSVTWRQPLALQDLPVSTLDGGFQLFREHKGGTAAM